MLLFSLNTFLMEYRSIQNILEINEVYSNANDSLTNILFNTERCTVSTASTNWYKVELHFIAKDNNNALKRYKFNTNIEDFDTTSLIAENNYFVYLLHQIQIEHDSTTLDGIINYFDTKGGFEKN